jgi:signal transduction histidine kinase
MADTGSVRRRWIINAGLVAVLLGAGFVISARWPGPRHLDWLGAALLVAAAVPLVARERWPLGVLAMNVAASIPFHANDFSHVAVAPTTMVALFAVAAQGSRRRTLLLGAAVLGIVAVGIFVVPHQEAPTPLAVLGVVGWILVALVAGEALRLHRAYLAEAIDRAERAERSRDQEARRQVAEERLRIAHDLHDLLAHSITAIQVQAGVAAHLLAEGQAGPARLAGVLEAITAACDDARGELTATVGALSERGPLPNLDQLRTLAEPAEAAGVTVEFAVRGARRPLPPAVQLVAYRIVQEALTNIAKHATARHAEITLDYRPDRLDLTVTDDGTGADDGSRPHGFGIRGMAERAAAIGGQAHAGACQGGFRVTATLPVPERPS